MRPLPASPAAIHTSDLVDPRIYRASFVPALLALVVVMFSLEARPRAACRPISRRTRSAARTPIADTGAARAALPGPAGGQPRRRRARGLRRDAGFATLGLETSRQRFFTDVDGEGDAELSNVIGRLRGRSDRQVVILAHRDSAGRPGAASALGHGRAARAGAGARRARPHARRSCSCPPTARPRAWPARGASPSTIADRQKVEAALVLDDIGAAGAAAPVRGPVVDRLEPRVAGARRAPSTRRSRRETGVGGGSESWLGQLVRLAWPLTLARAGPARARGHRRGHAHGARRAAARRRPGHAGGHLGEPADAVRPRRRSPACSRSTRPRYQRQAAVALPDRRAAT